MLGQWCAAGLAYADYWPLTFSEIFIILEGERTRRLRDHDEARARNFELAALISFAHHDPKNMPTFKSSQQADKPQAPADDAVDQARVRGFFIGMAMKGKAASGA